ncbi:MAG: hypothetical protein KDC84_16065, partial [Crocinitomicaceae bacterium]|nr:hypothetical protein [Crocinitomicaceae bacterium]
MIQKLLSIGSQDGDSEIIKQRKTFVAAMECLAADGENPYKRDKPIRPYKEVNMSKEYNKERAFVKTVTYQTAWNNQRLFSGALVNQNMTTNIVTSNATTTISGNMFQRPDRLIVTNVATGQQVVNQVIRGNYQFNLQPNTAYNITVVANPAFINNPNLSTQYTVFVNSQNGAVSKITKVYTRIGREGVKKGVLVYVNKEPRSIPGNNSNGIAIKRGTLRNMRGRRREARRAERRR